MLPPQLAWDSSAVVSALQAPIPLNARFRRIPVRCSQLATYATSAAVICTSGGVSAGLFATPAGQVTSGGSVAAGVHWNRWLHSLSVMKTSSTSWPK